MLRFSPRPNRAPLVEWREWGEDAFREAREKDKPVCLCITAFWCGVCQRMDETTFSDDVVTVLNAFFVPVRVEESQRPDVDLRYNQGGWPTIVFLTPAADLLFSTNYLDPEAFMQLLVQLADAHQRDPSALSGAARRTGLQAEGTAPGGPAAPLRPAIVAEITGMLQGLADPVHGGFGSGDKLLHTEANEFLLYLHETTGERPYLEPVVLMLDSLRRSRTFDRDDGGFFRYSSRPDWQEPHPEKLLDDQAALLGNYLHAYLLTDELRFRRTAEELIDYLDGTLFDGQIGAFSGCQDYVRLEAQGPGDADGGLMPVLDQVIYCDANARVVSAYLRAWWLLGRGDCLARALEVTSWLWDHLRAPDGGMYHYWDGAAQAPGMLMDVVRTGEALLDAYAYLGDRVWLRRAEQLAVNVLSRYRNPAGGFFDIAKAGRAALGVRMTVLTQNAALAALFLRLAALGNQRQYREQARWALQPFPDTHRRYGAFAAGFGHALALLLSEPAHVTIAGQPGDPAVRAHMRTTLARLRPRSPVMRFQAG